MVVSEEMLVTEEVFSAGVTEEVSGLVVSEEVFRVYVTEEVFSAGVTKEVFGVVVIEEVVGAMLTDDLFGVLVSKEIFVQLSVSICSSMSLAPHTTLRSTLNLPSLPPLTESMTVLIILVFTSANDVPESSSLDFRRRV
ncbi:hypothetical protein BaRGS_00026005 [Batillaria attramentaria]|uniref:Uncharacterized protein n=1 Tax=Batillaria attramentaria TaxID=370345 RepID=A0ABD0K5I6_9CAEN